MGLLTAILIVLGIAAVTFAGVELLGLTAIFGVALPYIAILAFVIGVVVRIWGWAKSPNPFRIPTTCGQAKSLDFIKTNPIDNPTSKAGVAARMGLEVGFFRSLFRNTSAEISEEGNLVYQWEKWLWLFALVFHWGMFFVLLRHFRFFTFEVPAWVTAIEAVDGVFLVDLHPVFLTGFFMLIGLTFLLLRRLILPKVRYISLLNDYFPLVLLLAIVGSGMWMRYLDRVDVTNIRELATSLVALQPWVPAAGDINVMFYIHFALVCTLLIYFPLSKLMHAFGVFMSPTRNQVNNSREVRHINPWNPVVEFHSYMAYENDFRDKMVRFGIPVEMTEEEAAAARAEEDKLVRVGDHVTLKEPIADVPPSSEQE